MGVNRNELFSHFRAHLRLPGQCPGQEEAFGRSEPLDDRGVCRVIDALLLELQQVGFPGDVESAQVADVFSDGQCAVDVEFCGQSLGNERIVLVDKRVGAFFELG